MAGKIKNVGSPKKKSIKSFRTYSAKPADVNRKWYIVDASTNSLGRVSTEIAQILTGKKKSIFTPHIDCGDFVVVTNADSVVVTGQKTSDKIYYHHTGHPGGIKARSLNEQKDIDSTEIIRKAVRGMIPNNKLREARLKRLKIYKDENHQHEAQKPIAITLKGAKQ